MDPEDENVEIIEGDDPNLNPDEGAAAVPIVVGEEGYEPPEGAPLSERDQKLADMAATIEASSANLDIGEPQIDYDEMYANEQGLPPAENNDTLVDDKSTDLPPGLVLRDGMWHQLLKVDGEEVYRPYGEVVADIQKDQAGAARLQHSVQFQQQLNTQQDELNQWGQQLALKEQQILANLQQPQYQQQPPDEGAVSNEDFTKDIGNLVDSLFAGDEDDAKSRMADLLAHGVGNQSPPVDVGVIGEHAAQIATQRVEQQLQVDRQADLQREQGNAFVQFSTAYPEIVSDPALFTLADAASDRIALLHPEYTTSQLLMAAGKEVKQAEDAKNVNTDANDDGEKDDQSERALRKARLQPIPGGRQVTGLPARVVEEVPATGAQIISEMRKSRVAIRNE